MTGSLLKLELGIICILKQLQMPLFVASAHLTQREKATFNQSSCVEIRDLLEFTKNRALIEDFHLSLQFNMVRNLTKLYLNGN